MAREAATEVVDRVAVDQVEAATVWASTAEL